MKVLKQCIRDKANQLREFWFDVDGVMTPQGAVTIYDVRNEKGLVGFERNDGVNSIRLVPCDENGTPLINVVEYVAGIIGESIMEGYRFDPRDGKVVEYLVQYGYPVYFISGRNSPCVMKRAKALGAKPFLGVKDKLTFMREHIACSLDEVFFVGDGIQDVEALTACGLTVAPADASPEAIQAADCITASRGGEGVISEIITLFLKEKGLWPTETT